MAIFRKLHVSFWSDSFTSELDRDKKLFYIYLITNEHTSQCGVYEITKKQIAFDLGYTIDTVCKMLEYFIKAGKIKYNDKTNELAIGNWMKYNNSTSPKVKTCINKEFGRIKDTLLIQYVNSIDTHPQEEEEEEEEEEKKKIYSPELIDLNERCKSYFDEKYVNDKSLECFGKLVRLDKYTVAQIKQAILNARGDPFWEPLFQTPVKLREKDKNGVFYIDKFLKIKQKTNGSHLEIDKNARPVSRQEY